MSLNSVELQHVGKTIEIEAQAGRLGPVEGLGFFEFPIEGTLPDLNLGLRFRSGAVVLISLRAPWTGLFLTQDKNLRPSKITWRAAFGEVQPFHKTIVGQTLVEVETFSSDRRIVLKFGNGATFELHLFPARPNWIFSHAGETLGWRGVTSGVARPTVVRPEGASLALAGSPAPAMALLSVDELFHKYLELRKKAQVERLFQQACQRVESEMAKVAKIRNEMRGRFAESKKAAQVRAHAEALKAILYAYPQQHRAARVPEVPVELNAKKTLAENAEDLFQRYKKLLRTEKELEVRLAHVEEKTNELTQALAKLRAALRPGQEAIKNRGTVKAVLNPLRLWDGLDDDGEDSSKRPERLPGKNEKKWQKSGIRSFVSKEGLKIWVGQTREENEELVIRLAKGNDVWMHVKTRPGAHAVIQVPKSKSASLESLLDAATLVAFYSGVEKGAKADVDYTFRKNVKRVPGGGKGGKSAAHFQVTYTHNKTLTILVDPHRLETLFTRE